MGFPVKVTCETLYFSDEQKYLDTQNKNDATVNILLMCGFWYREFKNVVNYEIYAYLNN